MAKETLKDKTAKGLAWSGISNIIQPVIGMAFGIYITRIMDAEDYGLIGALSIFSAFSATLVNGGLSAALVNRQNVEHRDYNAVFWFSTFTALVVYVILFVSAPLIAWFFEKPELTFMSRIYFLFIPFSGLSVVPNVILFKYMKTKQQAKINIVSMFVSGVAGAVTAANGFAYWAIVFQTLTYTVCGFVLRFTTASWHPTPSFDFSPLRSMYSFSSKIFFANIIQQINLNVCSVVLGKLFSTAQLGYYTNAKKWTTIGDNSITGMISQIVQPVIVQVNSDRERELRIFRKMLRFAAFAVFPAFLGLALISNEFITATIGSKWENSVTFVRLLCIGCLCSPFYVLYSNLLLSHGKSTVYMNGVIMTSAIQLVLLLVLYRFGIQYIVGGYIISLYPCLLYWHHTCSKIIDLTFVHLFRDLFPYFIITVIAVAAASLAAIPLQNIYMLLAVKISVTAAVYLSLLWFFGSKILKESVMLAVNKFRQGNRNR